MNEQNKEKCKVLQTHISNVNEIYYHINWTKYIVY